MTPETEIAKGFYTASATTSRSASSSNADAHLQRLERRYAARLWFWAWGRNMGAPSFADEVIQ
jgi:hypothetical protein